MGLNPFKKQMDCCICSFKRKCLSTKDVQRLAFFSFCLGATTYYKGRLPKRDFVINVISSKNLNLFEQNYTQEEMVNSEI